MIFSQCILLALIGILLKEISEIIDIASAQYNINLIFNRMHTILWCAYSALFSF